MDSGKYKRNNHQNTIKFKNTKYLERLQKVMDSARTASQSLEVRKRFIDRQNNMNYRNEFDRLHGELLHLKSPELIKEAINNMMDVNKLKAIGEYKEEASPTPTPGATTARGVTVPKTRGVRIRKVRERKQVDITDTEEEVADKAEGSRKTTKVQSKTGKWYYKPKRNLK